MNDIITETTPTTPEVLQDPICSVCGQYLHQLRGGLQPKLNADGTLSVVNISILGCTNGNYNQTEENCPMFNQEQGKIETPINLFEG